MKKNSSISGTNSKTRELEVIPAILVKDHASLMDSINKVKEHVKTIHIDVMDNKFVPNITIGINEINQLPKIDGVNYEFHWMVQKPLEWIRALTITGRNIHLIQLETISSLAEWREIKEIVLSSGGTAAFHRL